MISVILSTITILTNEIVIMVVEASASSPIGKVRHPKGL